MQIDSISPVKTPPVGFYFYVSFLDEEGKEDTVDVLFQKVSGLNATVETQELRQGGSNIFSQHLPQRITYSNLILERGLSLRSSLSQDFADTISSMQVKPRNVLVMLLDEKDDPLTGWCLEQAYPVKWSFSDLDASTSAVVIETMELTYSRLKRESL